MSFLIFFSVVFTVYFLANWYLYRHINAGIPGSFQWRRIISVSLILIMLAFPLSRIWLSMRPSPVADGIFFTGALWMAMMLYLMMGFLLYDLLRLISLPFPDFRSALRSDQVRTFVSLGVFGISFLLLAGGFINASIPKVNHLVIETAKRAGVDRLKMVLVTDIHMGSIIGKGKVGKMVEMVNAQQADLVLLGGDMVDDDLRPVKRKGLGPYFSRLEAPLGVYAVSGNHEHIGGADASLNYLAGYGVKVLRDTAVRLPEGVWIVGLEDKDMARFAGKSRKPLAEVMKEVDLTQPILLLDHQPVMLAEKAAAGVDLSFSGHTHDGQLWPLGHLAKAIYGISKGYLRVGEMQLYVSPGFGSWGPPVRIGHRPEILVVEWVFQKD